MAGLVTAIHAVNDRAGLLGVGLIPKLHDLTDCDGCGCTEWIAATSAA
jgi:hypothetical protein